MITNGHDKDPEKPRKPWYKEEEELKQKMKVWKGTANSMLTNWINGIYVRNFAADTKETRTMLRDLKNNETISIS